MGGFNISKEKWLLFVVVIVVSGGFYMKYISTNKEIVDISKDLKKIVNELHDMKPKSANNPINPTEESQYPKIELNSENVKQSEKIDIRTFLTQPHYNSLTSPADVDNSHSQLKQDKLVHEILNKRDGFFLEIGALDGKGLSNTWWLEKKHHWKGLLIEANPNLCETLKAHKRNAWALCACISDTTAKLDFMIGGALGGVKKHIDEGHLKRMRDEKVADVTESIPCFKMIDVLNVIGVKHIDYFSLDVEGGEIPILETMRKELTNGEITVNVWTIEYAISNESLKTTEKLKNLRSFFESVGGYKEHSIMSNQDIVFVRNKLL